MNYYIGIDGGGTKTAFACYDENDHLIAKNIEKSCHVLQVDDDQAIAILKAGIAKVLPKLDKDDKCYICAGLAGYGKNQQLRNRIEKIAAASFISFPYIIRNDGEIALAGALAGEDGILVISGTGSIGLAKIVDKFERCGGWGYMIGDEGSAYWIAKKLLATYTKQCDGRNPKTKLYAYLKNSWNLEDDYDVIAMVADKLQNKRDNIARLALQAYELAMQNDSAAIQIYEEAASQIAELIDALAINYQGKVKVSYAGGVWHAKDLLIKSINKYVHADIEIIDPIYEPEQGACLLAKQFFSQNEEK